MTMRVLMPVTIGGLADVAEREAGLASGLIDTTQQLGGALGVASTVATSHSGTSSARAARNTRRSQGAENVARSAIAVSQLGLVVQPALVNGAAGWVALRDGRTTRRANRHEPSRCGPNHRPWSPPFAPERNWYGGGRRFEWLR
jgi:hypothetical protein